MRIRKIRPGHKIAALLVAAQGNPVPLECIKELFKSEPDLAKTEYKISGYVGDIRKYDDGIVRVVKEGRKVVSYALANFDLFDEFGQNPKKNPVPVVKETTAVITATSETVVEPVMEATEIVAPVVANDDTIEVPTNADPTLNENPDVHIGSSFESYLAEEKAAEEAVVIDAEPKLDRNARRRAARAAAKITADTEEKIAA